MITLDDVLIADLETDGLLSEVSKIHCVVLCTPDPESEVCLYHDDETITPRHGSLEEGLRRVLEAKYISGHNWLKYDQPVLKKLRGEDRDPRTILDTMVMSRLVYSDRKERDFALNKAEKLEGKYVGQHSLAAWGARLGESKGEYSGGWDTFNQDMADYAVQDGVVTRKLFRVLWGRLPKFEAEGYTTTEVEHIFAWQLFQQKERGVKLDREAAMGLLEHLEGRRVDLEEEIQELFPPDFYPYKPYPNGKPRLQKCKYRGGKHPEKMVPFNPGSRQQLARRLERTRGWVPKELTVKGNPAMHEAVMQDLSEIYPEVKPVMEYLIVNNRIGILKDGDSAYFRLADENDILHGTVHHIGAVTHRCTHTAPNTGNVTSVRKPYGKELRAIFIPFPGYIQAGVDADGLELRVEAHYLYPFDGGEAVDRILHGSKEDGTDQHSMNARAISEIVPCTRDQAKTAKYADLYGAGDTRVGKIFGKGAKLGKEVKQVLVSATKGMKELRAWLRKCRKETGSVLSLDGRRIAIRHEHAMLNTLYQGGGAVIMKWFPVFLYEELEALGVSTADDFLQTGHIHDEIQGSLRPQYKEQFAEAVQRAGARVESALDLKVPLEWSPVFGENWRDTH